MRCLIPDLTPDLTSTCHHLTVVTGAGEALWALRGSTRALVFLEGKY